MSKEFELHDFEEDDLLPEYDLSSVEPGTAYRPLDQGYTVTIHKADGSTEVRVVSPYKDAIVLEADVKAYFPDSESVNSALRSIIALFPKESRRPPARSTTRKRAAGSRGGRS